MAILCVARAGSGPEAGFCQEKRKRMRGQRVQSEMAAASSVTSPWAELPAKPPRGPCVQLTCWASVIKENDYRDSK